MTFKIGWNVDCIVVVAHLLMCTDVNWTELSSWPTGWTQSQSQSQSPITTGGQSVIMSRYRAHSGTCHQILISVRRFFSEICCLVSVGRPLWREVGSVLCKSQFSHLSKSKSHYNWRSVSHYVKEFLSKGCFLKFAVLSFWGALSDERSGLSFVFLCLVICHY
jgi:hypothetical protein